MLLNYLTEDRIVNLTSRCQKGKEDLNEIYRSLHSLVYCESKAHYLIGQRETTPKL